MRSFYEQFFALNKYNMLVDSFLICFRQLYFLTEGDDFAKAIGFGWRPFWPIIKTLLFSNIRCFFEQCFA